MLKRIRKLDLAGWFYGLVAAVIGGGSNAVTAGIAATIIDPKDFGMAWKTVQLMGMSFAVAAILSFFTYLAKSPLPPLVERDQEVDTGTGKPR